MKVLLIGVTVLLASVNAKLAEKPIRHPDCPLDDDPQNPTHLSYPSDCGKFYKCLGGWAYPMQCPAGLHWNDVAKLCDWPNEANCKTSNKPILIAEESDKPIKHEDCPANDVGKPIHLPYPNDCTKFYKCSYGYAYPMNCPSGEHFGVEIDRCDWPWIAKCDSNATPPTAPTNPTTEPTTTPTKPPSPPTKPPPTKPPTTPPPTIPTVPPTTTPEPLPPGINCTIVPHGTLYPHPDSCQKFVQCDYGVGAVKYCPSNLHFNPKLLVCDWPEVAGCLVGKY